MKYVLVMGASGDIGSACVSLLAKSGWSIYCHYHTNQQKVTEMVQQLRIEYPNQDFFSVCLDMTQEQNLPIFLEQLFQVSAIVFASGQTSYTFLTDMSSSEMDTLWYTHLKMPSLLCQSLQEKLSQNKCGRIVFVGSIYGTSGSSLEVMYSALKGAQQIFAKAYAQEVSSLGITVNVVAPGAVDTHMNRHWTQMERDLLLAEIPAKRMADPLEVAQVIQFLLQDENQYLTGATIPVTGGWKL